MTQVPGASRLPPPRVEGSVRLEGGRRLGYAEFGSARALLDHWPDRKPAVGRLTRRS